MKSELRLKAEKLLEDFTPSQVAANLFAESGWSKLENFSRRVRQSRIRKNIAYKNAIYFFIFIPQTTSMKKIFNDILSF